MRIQKQFALPLSLCSGPAKEEGHRGRVQISGPALGFGGKSWPNLRKKMFPGCHDGYTPAIAASKCFLRREVVRKIPETLPTQSNRFHTGTRALCPEKLVMRTPQTNAGARSWPKASVYEDRFGSTFWPPAGPRLARLLPKVRELPVARKSRCGDPVVFVNEGANIISHSPSYSGTF